MIGAVRRGLLAFWAFWLDFLVGDTPEIFAGTLVLVGVALLLRHDRDVGIPLLTGLAVVLLALSTLRGRRRTT